MPEIYNHSLPEGEREWQRNLYERNKINPIEGENKSEGSEWVTERDKVSRSDREGESENNANLMCSSQTSAPGFLLFHKISSTDLPLH